MSPRRGRSRARAPCAPRSRRTRASARTRAGRAGTGSRFPPVHHSAPRPALPKSRPVLEVHQERQAALAVVVYQLLGVSGPYSRQRLGADCTVHFNAHARLQPLGGAAWPTVDGSVEHSIVHARGQFITLHLVPVLALVQRRNVSGFEVTHGLLVHRMAAPFFPHRLGAAEVGHAARVFWVVDKAALMLQNVLKRFCEIFSHLALRE